VLHPQTRPCCCLLQTLLLSPPPPPPLPPLPLLLLLLLRLSPDLIHVSQAEGAGAGAASANPTLLFPTSNTVWYEPMNTSPRIHRGPGGGREGGDMEGRAERGVGGVGGGASESRWCRTDAEV
jgi:hypothetical protein